MSIPADNTNIFAAGMKSGRASFPLPKIGIVLADFYADLARNLLQGAREAYYHHLYPLFDAYFQSLEKDSLLERQLIVINVPGAFEIPCGIKMLEKHHGQEISGFLGLGAVIRGETPHFEYISQACALGMSRLALDLEKPVAFGVLTTETLEHAKARAEPPLKGESKNKGSQAMDSLLRMVKLAQEMQDKAMTRKYFDPS